MEEQDKPVEKEESPAAAVEENSELPEPEPEAAPVPVTAGKQRGGRGLALLAILLGLLALVLSGWVLYSQQLQKDDGDTRQRAQLAQLSSSMDAAIRQQEQAGQALRVSLQQDIARLEQVQQAELEALRERMQQQRRRLLELGTTDRSDWMLAEVEYLLRLANQRMVMAGDVASALALMGSADEIVRSLDDARLHSLRAAITADLAALRAVPRIDIEGAWLRIQALVGQVDKLLLFELPDERPEVEALPASASVQEKFNYGLKAAWDRLRSYIVITRRDQPYEAMLDPQWEGLVRQNMRMLLEQSRSALLSGNQQLYQQSLGNARRWLGEFFSFNESGVAALDAELEALAGLDISPDLPALTASLAAARLAVEEKHSIAGGED